MNVQQVQLASHIEAPVAAVWQRVTSPEGINHELRPWLTMTIPEAFVVRAGAITPALYRPLGRSYLKLGGCVPVGFSDLQLSRFDINQGFTEQSRMSGMRYWRHDRQLSVRGEGCQVVDTLSFMPWFFPAFSRAIVMALFQHRHRRLQQYFASVGRV